MNTRKLLDWKTLFIYLHRWTGIVFGVIFVVWFISGVAMMYVGMPHLSDKERLGHVPLLNLSTVRVSPAEAARTNQLDPDRMRVEMYYDGRPIYRHVADLVASLAAPHRDGSGYGPLGAVVGATYPEQLVELRGRDRIESRSDRPTPRSQVRGVDRDLRPRSQWPSVITASSFATTWSMVKLAAFWRGGNSLNVSRNCATRVVAASAM